MAGRTTFQAGALPPHLAPFVPLRFQEQLYRPLAHVRLGLSSTAAALVPQTCANDGIPAAPAAMTAPIKSYNTGLERAVLDLCEKGAADAARLVSSAEDLRAILPSLASPATKAPEPVVAARSVVASSSKNVRPIVGAGDGDDDPVVSGPPPASVFPASSGAKAGSTMSRLAAAAREENSRSFMAAPAAGAASASGPSARAGGGSPAASASSAARPAAANHGSDASASNDIHNPFGPRPAAVSGAPSGASPAHAHAAGAGTSRSPAPPAAGTGAATLSTAAAPAPGPAPRPWSCPACTFENSAAAVACDMCGGEKPAAASQAAPAAARTAAPPASGAAAAAASRPAAASATFSGPAAGSEAHGYSSSSSSSSAASPAISAAGAAAIARARVGVGSGTGSSVAPPPAPSPASSASSASSIPNYLQPAAARRWHCNMCATANEASVSACKVCGSARGGSGV